VLLTVASLHALACAAAPQPAAADPASSLAELSGAVRTLSDRVNRSVVRVEVAGYAPVPGPVSTPTSLLAREQRSGSGVVVDPDGLILTNAHVVTGGTRLSVILPSPENPQHPARRSILPRAGDELPATLVGLDLETDLALLRVPRRGLTPLELADSDGVRPGDLVLAFGSPLGLEGSVSLGVVSAVARQTEPDSPMVYIQTDAAINPGSSGGPLVDTQGRVIGINTFIASQSGGNEGLAFAAPSNIARAIVEQLAEHGRVRRGVIGVHAQTITPALAEGLGLPQRWGVVLADVYPGGPGELAGLETGDVVVAMDGKLMENARQLDVNIYQRRPGDEVSLVLRRGGDELTVDVPVVERPDDPGRLAGLADPRANAVERLGIVALDLTPELRRLLPIVREPTGVVVAAGAATGPFRPGDILHAIDGREVGDLAALRRLLAAKQEAAVGRESGAVESPAPGGASSGEAPGRRPLVVTYERNGRFAFAIVD
jgi:serine protease Do